MTNSWVNVSHFQHQHCYSQHCKSHQNDSTARARGCHFLPNRCQNSISRRKRCEQDDPFWLGGSVQNPDIAQRVTMAMSSRMRRWKNIPSTNYATGVLSLHKNDCVYAPPPERLHDGGILQLCANCKTEKKTKKQNPPTLPPPFACLAD